MICGRCSTSGPGGASEMRVFVYGTLRRGASNACRMNGGTRVGDGTVLGRLFKVDWYPGLVLDPDGGPVRGEVWEVSAGQLEELDRFEGCDPASGVGGEYQRRMTPVELDDGRTVEAWAWDWTGPVEGIALIEGGDWLG